MNEIKKTLKLIAKYVNSNRISEKDLYSYYNQLIKLESDDPRKEIILNTVINKLLEINPLYLYYLDINDEELIEKYKQILIKRNLGICDLDKPINNHNLIDDEDLLKLSIQKNAQLTVKKIMDLEIITNIEMLIDLLKEVDYVFDEDTPSGIAQDDDLQYHSYMLDNNSVEFMPCITSEELVKLLIKEGREDLFSKFHVQFIQHFDYYEKHKELFDMIFDIVESDLTSENTLNLFKQYALQSWESYKIAYRDYLVNVREKVLTLLDQYDNIIEFSDNLEIYYLFETLYGKTYIDNLFRKYFKAKRINETKLLNTSKEEIEKTCRLFNSKLRDYHINEEIENLNEVYRNMFSLKEDSKKVNKLLKEKKQRELFTKSYLNNGYPDLLEQIFNSIKTTLNVEYKLNDKEIKEIIESLLKNEININEPEKYKLLVKSIEVSKIVNRLNSGYINESDKDYINNKDYITYKIINGKKIYSTIPFNFTIDELIECKKYISQLTVIKLSNNILMPIIKKIEVEISPYDLANLELEFNDENYEYDNESHFNITIATVNPLVEELSKTQDNLSKEEFDQLLKFLKDYQILLITLLVKIVDDEEEEFGENWYDLKNFIKNYHKLKYIFDLNKLDINHYNEIIKYTNILKEISLNDLSILGLDLVETIINDDSFNLEGAKTKDKLSRALNLYIRMITKNNFTVPRINGIVGDINYSIMEQNDPHLLKCGYETDACFRPCGHDNDFLHYCCLNPNGFVIKLTDKNGNFLGRASGFRSGNGIFLNQLRTIYDESGDYNYSSRELTNKIVAALKECCDQIIIKTSNSKEPIDFVIINRAYSLESLPEDVFGKAKTTNEFQALLHKGNPIYLGPNYKEFLTLDGVQTKKKFTTDYGGDYTKLVISSRKPLIDASDYIKYDANPCYHRNRSQVKEEILTKDNYYEINKIKLIKNKLNNKKQDSNFELINKDYIGNQVIYGNNWYIIHDGNKILDFECIEQDEYALFECQKYLLLHFEKTKTI